MKKRKNSLIFYTVLAVLNLFNIWCFDDLAFMKYVYIVLFLLCLISIIILFVAGIKDKTDSCNNNQNIDEDEII